MVPSWDMIAANLMAMQSPAISSELRILLGSGSSFRFLLRDMLIMLLGFRFFTRILLSSNIPGDVSSSDAFCVPA